MTDFEPALLRRIRALAAAQPRVLVAIDGRCAAGKTTLAASLQAQLACNVFHMDDFFLRSEQRTAARFAEPGGNVDRERFLAEVLTPLRRGEKIFYRRFDCASMQLQSAVETAPGKLVVTEGAYSMHPELAPYYDLSVFLDISPELQRERILRRNTPEKAEQFLKQPEDIPPAHYIYEYGWQTVFALLQFPDVFLLFGLLVLTAQCFPAEVSSGMLPVLLAAPSATSVVDAPARNESQASQSR